MHCINIFSAISSGDLIHPFDANRYLKMLRHLDTCLRSAFSNSLLHSDVFGSTGNTIVSRKQTYPPPHLKGKLQDLPQDWHVCTFLDTLSCMGGGWGWGGWWRYSVLRQSSFIPVVQPPPPPLPPRETQTSKVFHRWWQKVYIYIF